MRWFVEVSHVGDAAAAERYCVEAKAWQAALQEARKLRGDSGPLSKFSIELLDDGYRAVDPVQKIRYLVNQAPADTPLAAVVLGVPNGSVHPTPSAIVAAASAPTIAAPAEAAPPAPAPLAAAPPPAALAAPAVAAPAAPAAAVPAVAAPVAPVVAAPVTAVPVVAAPVAVPAAVAPAAVAPVAVAPVVVPSAAPPVAAVPAAVSAPPVAAAFPAPVAPVVPVAVAPVAADPGAVAAVPRASDAGFPRPSIPRPAASRPPAEGVAASPAVAIPKAAPLPSVGLEPVAPAIAAPSSVAPARVVDVAPPILEPAAPNSGSNGASAPSHLETRSAPGTAAPVPVVSDVTTLPGPAVAPVGAHSIPLRSGAVLEYRVVRSRTEEPSPEAPITYRETAYAVAPGVSREAVEALLRDRLAAVKEELSSRAPGQLVQLAIFDHVFEQRPLHAPLGTLAWKDWRGDPVIGFPAFGDSGPPVSTSVPPPAVSPEPAPAPSPQPAAPEPPAPPAAAESSEGVAAVTPVPGPEAAPRESAEVHSVAVTATAPVNEARAPEVALEPGPSAAERGSRPRLVVARRRIGEDIIGDLFELMHELHFARDLAIGADFVQSVLAEVLPTEVCIVQVFDINKRQFVVVRARGAGAERAILHRTADSDPLLVEIMRREGGRTQQATDDPRYSGGRWGFVGVPVGEVLAGPARQGGRYLGTIEVANPLGGTPFHESEINAFDYICEQFAEFVASRPIVLDPDVILPR